MLRAYSTLHSIHSIFGSLTAELTSVLKHNIMYKVEPFRNVELSKEINYWTFEEFNKFIVACDDEEMKLLFKFLYITGCRKGECQALSWNDIDFDKKTVRINKNITRKTTEGTYKIVSPTGCGRARPFRAEITVTIKLESFFAKQKRQAQDLSFCFGGEEKIRTSAPVIPTYTLSRGASSANLSTSPQSTQMHFNDALHKPPFLSLLYNYTQFSCLCQ